jgi:hypothetical protein
VIGTWKQPQASRILLALLFAVAFLANGGLGLWVGLTGPQPHVVNGMSAVVFVFGLVALAGAVSQFLQMRRPSLAKGA